MINTTNKNTNLTAKKKIISNKEDNKTKTKEVNKAAKKEVNKTKNKEVNKPINKETNKPINKESIKVTQKEPIKTAIKEVNKTEKKITSKPVNAKINKIIDDFQLKIFQEINNSNIATNIMVSPLSIYHILSLTTNGAANKTLAEMLRTLCSKNKIELNKNNQLISSSIEKLKSIEIANVVFTKFKPLDNFMIIMKEYKAKIDILKDADQVNKWCNDATHNKITTIIDKVTRDDLMILINAIYFKGIWQDKFDKNLTNKEKFMNFNNNPKEVEFMHITKKFDYFEDKNNQVISLNYQKDNLKALIILPKTQTDINVFIQNLSIEYYNIILKKLVNKKVIFSLPKFEIRFNAELKKNFISLGMVEPFSTNADFSTMKKEKDIHIDQIIHKTFIKVDEKGTEAAAVTAVIMRKNAAFNPEPDIVMNVNHPFLFIIRSNDLPAGHDMLFVSKIECL